MLFTAGESISNRAADEAPEIWRDAEGEIVPIPTEPEKSTYNLGVLFVIIDRLPALLPPYPEVDPLLILVGTKIGVVKSLESAALILNPLPKIPLESVPNEKPPPDLKFILLASRYIPLFKLLNVMAGVVKSPKNPLVSFPKCNVLIGVFFPIPTNPLSKTTNEADALVFSTRRAVVADVAPEPRRVILAPASVVVLMSTLPVVEILSLEIEFRVS